MQMNSSLTERIDSEFDKLIKEYGTGKESLMPIMQEMNTKFGYLSEYIIMELAKAFDMSATEIYGTATFYHYLRTEPMGKYVISVCSTISCDLAGKAKIVKVLENELGMKMGETSADNKFTLEFTSCIGLCDQSPAMLINDKAYTNLNPQKVIEILKEYK